MKWKYTEPVTSYVSKVVQKKMHYSGIEYVNISFNGKKDIRIMVSFWDGYENDEGEFVRNSHHEPVVIEVKKGHRKFIRPLVNFIYRYLFEKGYLENGEVDDASQS